MATPPQNAAVGITSRDAMSLLTTDTCAVPAPPNRVATNPYPLPPPPPLSEPAAVSPRKHAFPASPPSPLHHANGLNTAALQSSIASDVVEGCPPSATTQSPFVRSSPSLLPPANEMPQHHKQQHQPHRQQHHHHHHQHHQSKTVVIVVNVLPLVFERNATDSGWDVEWSSSATSLFYRNLVGDHHARYRALFIGCPEVFVAREEELAVETQLRAFHCVPVFLDPQVAHRYFQGFCKGVLWPVFHNVVDVYNSAKLSLDEFKQDEMITNNTTTSDASLPLPSTATKPGASPPTNKKPTSKPAWCDPKSWNPAAQDLCWGDYCSVNRTFARRVIESYHDGYLIWIHDFPFLMLPSYLLRKLRSAMIAMYLHVPFPSSEIFRCLAMRTEILRAMLCADHIGFLVFEHARHFLTSCKRLLGLNYRASSNGMLVIEYNGRLVNISCSHIEPDVHFLHTILDQHHTDRHDSAHQFKKRIERFVYDATTKKRKFVVASVDRLEGLSALPLKLRAFDRFLAQHPHKRGSVVLVQIGISLDSRPNDYQQTREYVLKFVHEINRRWASGPADSEQVVYFEEKPKTTCAERMHLWRMSDVYVDTCVRYGLSLLPFEYLVAQKRNVEHATRGDVSAPTHGVMIVSEFASYSRIFNGCLLVNPWKTDDLVNALVKASEMQYYEKLNRFQLNYKLLVIRSQSRWADSLLADFEELMEKKQQAIESRDTVEVGFGFGYRVMQFASGFVKLDTDELVRAATRCTRRLFIFDYGGTLSWTTSILDEDGAAHHFRQHQETMSTTTEDSDVFTSASTGVAFGQEVIRYVDGQVRTPLSQEARENLQTLCADPQNVVFVVSTGRKAELDAEFGAIPHLNLVSDNGFFVKRAEANKKAQWECVYDQHDLKMDWKDDVQRLMQSYTSRTNGAFLIVGEASLLYDYRQSDPEYGEIQALELYEQLRQVIKKGEATIHREKGFLEVHQFGVSKAVAVSLILHHLKQHVGVPDFAMYAGDDESDELAFKALQAFAEQEPSLAHVFTCTVGMKPSKAQFYVDSVTDVLAVIHAIAVRMRLGNRRSGGGGASSYPRHGYLDAFLEDCTSIVDPVFLHNLSTESLGDDLSDPLFSNKTSSSPRGSSSHEAVVHSSSVPSLRQWPLMSSTSWLALGSGVALGTIAGLAIGSTRLPVQSRAVATWIRSQLQRVPGS